MSSLSFSLQFIIIYIDFLSWDKDNEFNTV